METEATVLEMLGLITQSLSVGSVATGGQIVSGIPQLQTENCISTQPIVATTNDTPAIEKSDEHSLANIQRLVGSIEEIENEVENSLHADHTEDSISDDKAGGNLLFQKQTLQTESKTGNLVDEVAFISDSCLLTRTAGRRYEVLDEEDLVGQERTEGNVTSVTDNRAEVCSRDSLAVGNNVVISNSHVQNTLPAFLSGQPESVDKLRTLPATNESTSELCVTNLNRSCEPSSMSTDINARTFQPTQVAHIAYCTSSSSNKHLNYAMRKHIMEELLVNPYMCGICGDIFNSTLNLSQHVLSCHTLQMMQGSKIDGSMQGESNFDHPKRKEAREHLPIMSPKDEPQNGRNLDNMYLENLLQSSLGNEYKMSKDHGKNYESKASTEKNKKITTTPDENGGQKETEKLKLSTKSDTESMNMQRQCERSDESFPEVISRVELKGECLDSVRNSGMESKVKEKEDTGLAKSKAKREKAFKCEFCEDLFTSNKYRYKHRVASHPEAVFQCPGCEKSYKVTEKDKWQHHIRTHNKPPKKPKLDSYSCSVCSVVFRAPNAVAIHMQTFHPEAVRGEKRFCCEICGNLFRTKSALKSHQSLVHSDEKPYQCETCGKGFKKESYLKLHRRTHTGEKPFTCKFCNKMFPSTTGRRSHERTHTNERPYKCTYCCSSFRAKPQLVEHERTHTQERPFVCPLCGKSFASRTSFKTHQFLHTGEKPYKCRSCSRSFAQKSNLTDHFRSIHSQEKPYECTVCSAKFTRSTSRKVHMEKKHGLAITVRQGRPPTHESNPTVDSIVATCLSIDVGSVLTPTEHQTLGDSFSMIVNNLTS